MSEKLCFQRNEFQDFIKGAFRNIRVNDDFADVTLACEDGEQVVTHKVILAASSPFFQKLLARNKQTHPIIFMRGVKSEDLLPMVDFLYHGEANIFQENLQSFLALAEDLQMKGMARTKDKTNKDFEVNKMPLYSNSLPSFHINAQIEKAPLQSPVQSSPEPANSEESRASAIGGNFSGVFDELEEKIKGLMERSQT